jgi:anti-anti-sigma regulatory factor/uncharacterized protein (DUF433 family)
MKRYFYADRKPAFSLLEEPDCFRLKMELPEIEEHHVEEFLDKTVEWLSANSEKGMVIDFEGVTWVCSDFTAHLAKYCEDARTKGLAVTFVNVGDTIKPFIDIQARTQVLEIRRGVLSISTKEVLEDIERNLPDRDLMHKYGLSLNGLTTLFRKLFNKGLITRQWMERRNIHEAPIEIDLDMEDLRITEIPAADILKDIADDMPDEILMHKYGLSQKGLDSVWMQLSANNLISEETLRQRLQRKKSCLAG